MLGGGWAVTAVCSDGRVHDLRDAGQRRALRQVHIYSLLVVLTRPSALSAPSAGAAWFPCHACAGSLCEKRSWELRRPCTPCEWHCMSLVIKLYRLCRDN